MAQKLHLLASITLVIDVPDERLSLGQVGTIVELLADDAFEVEFADTKGHTLTNYAVEARDLLKLTHELTV